MKKNQSLTSITELPNELTNDIDLADGKEICRLFRQSDAQIFDGWRHFPALRDKEILNKIRIAVERIAKIIKSPRSKKIVITGAGTSGRLAMFACRTFNYLLKDLGQDPVFEYIIAGTDKALIKAQEGAEDDPIQGVKELKEKAGTARQVVFIGITCGFSAPYIAGQLDYASQQNNYFSIFLGFNPEDRARNVPIEKWNKTVFQVVQEVRNNPNCLILNPVLGPEPITGSTRMKGGSATKLILEIIFTLALMKAGLFQRKKFIIPEFRNERDLVDDINLFIDLYDKARIETYRVIDHIAEVMEAAGESLRSKGHVYYIGESPHAVLGTVDASECPPTFGAWFEDVRGFIKGGWKWMLDDGDDSYLLLTGEPWYRIDLTEFEKHKLPNLNKHDILIGIAADEKRLNSIKPLLLMARKKSARTALILLNTKCINPTIRKSVDYIITPPLTCPEPLHGYDFFAQLSLKLILNAITTGAHIFCGKVYQNRMIDLRISNNKLFYRTIGILRTLLGVDEETARRAIIASIFRTDTPTRKQLQLPVSEYVSAATPQEKIVPIALLLSTGKFDIKHATVFIRKVPIIRAIIEQYT